MRKLAIVLALASTALATPALARDDSWYVGVEGGPMIVEDINFDVRSTTGVNSGRAASVDHRYGWDADGVIGYDFGGFRVETEVGYRTATVDSYRSSLATPAFTSTGALVNAGTGNFDYAGGKTSALSFMLNGLLDFGDDDGLQGFVGGGVGAARVKAKYGLNRFGRFLNDADTVFAYQGIAGVRAAITDNIDASIKYRFFTAPNIKLNAVNGSRFDGRYRSHSLLGGLTLNFSKPEPVAPPPADLPPPPPPPPPPQPEPQVVCSPGPFIVFFEWDKSDITPEAASILDNAVTQYQNCGNAQVMVAGFTDKSGAASYNVGLSQRRANAAKGYLSSRAIPEGQISTEAFGETRPRVDTADGVREVQNRRVEVTYGPGAGQ